MRGGESDGFLDSVATSWDSSSWAILRRKDLIVEKDTHVDDDDLLEECAEV